MKRRELLTGALGAAAALAAAGPGMLRAADLSGQAPKGGRFKLKYAPSFGQFKNHAGEDLAAQVQFAADEGFSAMFDNGIMSRPIAEQELIARELAKREMTLGPFVLYADFKVKSFVTQGPEVRRMLLDLMKRGVETAKRVNCPWALVVPGRYDESLAWEYQTANVIDNLRTCTEICEPAGLILVLEPLNPRDHPGLFLTRIPQAYEICRAVASPSCKILDDLYHQQISEGNLIPNIEIAWDELAAFHIGDNPGRKEPTSGEINYKNIFKYLHKKGYQGVLCMEHGQSLEGKQGERAVIEAYRACDDF
ncbi:MAG TPA: TIM barrel protein [Candidatus Desulfaltia sp.]|nr:TIM barrel protein [Candidatus Desulfaltia sp.]